MISEETGGRGSRRNFLKVASLAPASADRVHGANNVVNIVLIGCGSISQTNIPWLQALENKIRIVAVCDIYKPNLDRAVAQTKAEGYHDYKDVLARKDVDADNRHDPGPLALADGG